jgi:hypothetical protein
MSARLSLHRQSGPGGQVSNSRVMPPPLRQGWAATSVLRTSRGMAMVFKGRALLMG